ncbi:MAG: hypothetical protein ABSH20_26610 [Tepidisphaeraceae bacterium]
MRIRATSPLSDTFECPAVVTSHHPHSCYGGDVLVLLSPDGGAIGPKEAAFAGYEVIGATEEECNRLRRAGYDLAGLEHGCECALR